MEEEEELNSDISDVFKSIQAACDGLTGRGQEFLLVAADPISQSCMKIGSEKGRQFLDVNADVVINFFSYCFGAQVIGDFSSEQPVIDDEEQALLNEHISTEDGMNVESTQANTTDTPLTIKPEDTTLDTRPACDEYTALISNTVQGSRDMGQFSAHTGQSSVVIDNQMSVDTSCQAFRDLDNNTSSSSDLDNNTSSSSDIESVSGQRVYTTLTSHPRTLKTSDSVSNQSVYTTVTTLTMPENGTLVSVDFSHKTSDAIGGNIDNGTSVAAILSDKSLDVNPSSIKPTEGCKQGGDLPVSKSLQPNDWCIVVDPIAYKDETTPGVGQDKDNSMVSTDKGKTGVTQDKVDKDDLTPEVPQDRVDKDDLPPEVPQDTGTVSTNELTSRVTLDNKNKNKQSPGVTKDSEVVSTEECMPGVTPDKEIESTNEITTDDKFSVHIKSGVSKSSQKKKGMSPRKAKGGSKNTKSVKEIPKNTVISVNKDASKPTCSVCQATFSRIHSLKGHMLIKHGVEITLDDLLSGKTVPQEDGASPMEEEHVKTSLNSTDNDIITLEDEGVNDNFNDTPAVQKRKLFDRDNKNVKRHKPDDCSDNEEETISVLEENHEENIPKKFGKSLKSKKLIKISDNVYCDICDKVFQKEINLTIHNIRFHPSRFMMQFGVDMSGSLVPIKQEPIETIVPELTDVKQEDFSDMSQENDDTAGFNGIVDPWSRIDEIKENEEIQKYMTLTEVENERILIQCSHCDLVCDEFHQMLVHLAKDHTAMCPDLDLMIKCFYGIQYPNKKCDKCSKSFISIKSLWSHITVSHPECLTDISKRKLLRDMKTKYKGDQLDYKCSECGEVFNSIRALDLHMKEHPNIGRRYHCPQCLQPFSSKPNMTRHFKQIHLEEKKFQCDICGKSFKQKSTLKFHRTTHEIDKPRLFECHICNKKLRKKETLQIHLRQHEGIKPYVCEICGMAFSQNGNRKKHKQLTHSEVRSLECDECGKSFKLKEHLKRHMKMHMLRGDEIPPGKTYACPVEGCGARYLSFGQLKYHHMAKHTNERPFTCDTCGKGFITRDKLTRHEQIHVDGSTEAKTKDDAAMHEMGETDQLDNYDTVIIPQENGAPIKVQLAHTEPITTEAVDVTEDQTYYIRTEGEDNTVQVDDNTILVDPSVLESVLGASSDEQTVFYYVTGS